MELLLLEAAPSDPFHIPNIPHTAHTSHSTYTPGAKDEESGNPNPSPYPNADCNDPKQPPQQHGVTTKTPALSCTHPGLATDAGVVADSQALPEGARGQGGDGRDGREGRESRSFGEARAEAAAAASASASASGLGLGFDTEVNKRALRLPDTNRVSAAHLTHHLYVHSHMSYNTYGSNIFSYITHVNTYLTMPPTSSPPLT